MLLPAALTLLLIPVRSQTADSNATANSNPAHPTLAEFREASYTFFSRMRDAGYGQTSAVVFGAASIKNHFPDFRSTPDLDLVIFEPYDLRLDTILEAMVAGSGGKLSWENDKELLYYNGEQPPGRRVHLDAGYVDFGELYGTGMTSSAAAADTVTSIDAVPYATPEEMFIIKICAARSRSALAKSLQDIADAEFIAERVAGSVLQLVGDPPEKAVECLKAFLPRSKYPREWWLKKLGVGSLEYCRPDGDSVQQELRRAKDVCWGNAVLLEGQL